MDISCAVTGLSPRAAERLRRTPSDRLVIGAQCCVFELHVARNIDERRPQPSDSRTDVPYQAIEAGASLQRGSPGMLAIDGASVGVFAVPWHDAHGNPGTPRSPAPPYIKGTCAYSSSPCVG
jgi:hypothetical protein